MRGGLGRGAVACHPFRVPPFAALLGLLEAIGRPLDGDDLGVVHQAIDQRDDTGGVGEDLAPLGEGAVGGNQGGLLFVAAADEFEQQVGVAVGVGQVADLIELC